MPKSVINSSNYKAIDDIHAFINNILITWHIIAIILFYFISAFLMKCSIGLLFLSFIFKQISKKNKKVLPIWFHLNLLANSIFSTWITGWDTGLWMLILALIFSSYFSAFENKIITYSISIIEMLIIIALYFLIKNKNIIEPALWMQKLSFSSVFIFIFYSIIRLSLFANIISNNDFKNIQIEKEKFENMAQHDFLTGLLNRRTIEKILNQELEIIKNGKSKANLVVMLGDIDNFKKINDTYGHPYGDTIIKGIANILKSSFRQKDYICRWGGEEFFIMIPSTNTHAINNIMNRLGKNISTLKLPDKNAVTMTFGMIVCQNGTDIKMEEAIKKADELLYKGKKNGKDRIEMEILK